MAKNFQNTKLGRRLRGIGEMKDFAFPEDCGDISISIDKNGVWYYRNSPIGRDSIWKLFASILQKDSQGNHWLVTPHERMEVAVADAPFMAVGVERVEDDIEYKLNTGVVVRLGREHPLYLKQDASGHSIPYLTVRGNLTARLTRSVFYHTVDLSSTDEENGCVYLMSGGENFILGQF